jgi:hypothetical protein
VGGAWRSLRGLTHGPSAWSPPDAGVQASPRFLHRSDSFGNRLLPCLGKSTMGAPLGSERRGHRGAEEASHRGDT